MPWALQAGRFWFNAATARTYALLSIKKLGLLDVRNVPCGNSGPAPTGVWSGLRPSWLPNRHPGPLAWL